MSTLIVLQPTVFLTVYAIPEFQIEFDVLGEPNGPYFERVIRGVQEVAQAKRVDLRILKAGTATEGEIDAAFASLVHLQAGGLILDIGRRDQVAALASRHAVPAISLWRDSPVAGGLISYGPSLRATYRIKGSCAGRILNGTHAANLPVQQPTKFELVINLKIAKVLGLTVLQSLLASAAELIE